jgi:hypothetical protein
MENILLNEEKIDLLNQLLDELKHSLNSLSDKDLTLILIELAKESAWEVYKDKEDIFKGAVGFTKKKITHYKEKGIEVALKDDIASVKAFIGKIPRKYKNFVDGVKAMKRKEKIEIIISIILGLAVYFVSAGGFDFEGGIPDTDITVGGIGMHRSIWFHSIIAGVTVEFIMRFAYKTLNVLIENLPENHHAIWDRIGNFIEKNQSLTIAAMWLGIATHLLKDTGLIAGNFKSYSDLPVGLSNEYHRAVMSANGLASTLFAAGNIKNRDK